MFLIFIQYKIANILGAAGTDIPIKEIKSYLNPYEVRSKPQPKIT